MGGSKEALEFGGWSFKQFTTGCNSGKNVWRGSRIRGEEVDLSHNRHGSDEMRGSLPARGV